MSENLVTISAPRDDEMSLLELADRLLNRGVVLTGEATLSVAGVDLIYLGLNVVLTAVQNLKNPPGTRGSRLETGGHEPRDDAVDSPRDSAG
jgi:hypothetical protein